MAAGRAGQTRRHAADGSGAAVTHSRPPAERGQRSGAGQGSLGGRLTASRRTPAAATAAAGLSLGDAAPAPWSGTVDGLVTGPC